MREEKLHVREKSRVSKRKDVCGSAGRRDDWQETRQQREKKKGEGRERERQHTSLFSNVQIDEAKKVWYNMKESK